MMMRDMQPIERYTGQIKDGLILGNNLVILIHLCGPPSPTPNYGQLTDANSPTYKIE